MSYVISLDSEGRFVRVDLEAPVEVRTMASAAVEALALASKHGIGAFLFDFRKTRLVERTIGIYQIASSLGHLGFSRSHKIAGLISETDPNHRFFETVARNIGFEVRYFTDPAEAERWLSVRKRTPSENA